MEKESELDTQNVTDSVTAAASDALREILDKIDIQDVAQPVSSTLNGADMQQELASPQARCTSDGSAAGSEPATNAHQEPSEDPGDADSHPSSGDVAFSLSLPHEGGRWMRLRDLMIRSPHFEEYFRRTEGSSSWSIDEAFASFCLDHIEKTMAPSVAKSSEPNQAKKGTRRKGQPKKYERTTPTNDGPLRALRKRRSQENGLKLSDKDDNVALSLDEEDDEQDEDFLAMDDNPEDLDYQPVPIIRYPKRRRKSLPRSIKNNQAPPKALTRPKKTTEGTKPPRKKQPTPKRPTPAPKKTPKLEPYGPPRKRGRPRKVVTESQKKLPKPRVKAPKPAKQYIRMEVRLQRLPKMYECKTCFEQFPEAEDITRHFIGVHQRDRVPLPAENSASTVGATLDLGGLDIPGSLLPDVTGLANLLRQCPKCKKFVDNMTVHRREHRERNFICEECGKGFTENQILQKHKKVHEMDRTGDRYKCELCDKSYRFSQNLRSHMLYHGGEKTFICDHCGKSFYTNNRLIIHSAIHMKEKPYKCGECGRGFSQKSNMQKHERVHTGVKPYQCDLCMESFNHKVSLKNHKKKHHGIDWWKDVGRPKPVSTRKAKDTSQSVIVNREEQVVGHMKQNTVQLEKEQPVVENHWKGGTMPVERENNAVNCWRDERQPMREVEPAESPWHRQESELSLEHQNVAAAEEAVRLQTLQQAGNQWKGANIPMERQGQVGDQAMATFFYPSTYLQGYTSGYSGMPVIPVNTDASGHPSTRPTYQQNL